jgi:predicted HD superfamily hydrolase involved in NAD metabolism
MNNQYIEDLRKQVKKALKEDKMRYRHTLGVADTAACLAMRYNIDMERAYIAGLLHDCAKCVPDDVKIKECKKYGISVTESEKKSPYLLHAKLGAYYAKNLYGIKDDEICSAVCWHTTGHANMTRLEEIIYIADYIEPYRNKADNLAHIRELAFTDISMAVYEVTRDTLSYLEKKGGSIDQKTQETFNYYELRKQTEKR